MQKKFESGGMGALPAAFLSRLRAPGGSKGVGDGAGPSAGPSNEAKAGPSRRDIMSWLTASAGAFREAGGGRALKELAIEAREEAARRVDRRYTEKIEKYRALLREDSVVGADDDNISVSSWEQKDAYQHALSAWKDAQNKRIPGNGYKAVARRYGVSGTRLNKLIYRDEERRGRARDPSADSSDFFD